MVDVLSHKARSQALVLLAIALALHAAVPAFAAEDDVLSIIAVDPNLGHARTFFRRHDYPAVLLLLEGHAKSLEAKWMVAESLFRLHNYLRAKTSFEQILKETKDPIERRKAEIRLFDVDLLAKDLQGSIDRYVKFKTEYKKATARMSYGLGKALYDVGYFDRADAILRSVPKGSEFYLRARYIMAAIGLDKRSPQASAKLFRQIEDLPMVSVEDHAVHEMAILAQGRIFADSDREDLAAKAYERVSLAGKFGETATIELVRAMLYRAEQARLGDGRFKKSSAFRRELVEKEAILSASRAIGRFRKAHEIDWQRPELLTLMASVLVETKRYEDARIAYDELIGHFRPIEEALVGPKNDHSQIWPYFALDYDRKPRPDRRTSLIAGVPESLIKRLPDVKELLLMRARIEESGRQLRALETRAVRLDLVNSKALLARVRQNQQKIERAYDKVVIRKQTEISHEVANILNRSLAEAEFKRAELVLREMGDLKKKLDVVQDFQSEQNDQFEKSLKELHNGGTP